MIPRILAIASILFATTIALGGVGTDLGVTENAAASCIIDPVHGGCLGLPCVEVDGQTTCVPCKVPKYNVNFCLY